MTIEQMDKEIRDYCLSLILKSVVTDWKKEDYRQIIKDNIVIIMYNNKSYSQRFKAYIYTDNKHSNVNAEIVFDSGWTFNKEKRKERRIVQAKWDEIYYYFENKSNYERAVKTYNLLPIKELRKKKLQIIKKDV